MTSDSPGKPGQPMQPAQSGIPAQSGQEFLTVRPRSQREQNTPRSNQPSPTVNIRSQLGQVPSRQGLYQQSAVQNQPGSDPVILQQRPMSRDPSPSRQSQFEGLRPYAGQQQQQPSFQQAWRGRGRAYTPRQGRGRGFGRSQGGSQGSYRSQGGSQGPYRSQPFVPPISTQAISQLQGQYRGMQTLYRTTSQQSLPSYRSQSSMDRDIDEEPVEQEMDPMDQEIPQGTYVAQGQQQPQMTLGQPQQVSQSPQQPQIIPFYSMRDYTRYQQGLTRQQYQSRPRSRSDVQRYPARGMKRQKINDSHDFLDIRVNQNIPSAFSGAWQSYSSAAQGSGPYEQIDPRPYMDHETYEHFQQLQTRQVTEASVKAISKLREDPRFRSPRSQQELVALQKRLVISYPWSQKDHKTTSGSQIQTYRESGLNIQLYEYWQRLESLFTHQLLSSKSKDSYLSGWTEKGVLRALDHTQIRTFDFIPISQLQERLMNSQKISFQASSLIINTKPQAPVTEPQGDPYVEQREYGWSPNGYRLLENNWSVYINEIYIYLQSYGYLINHPTLQETFKDQLDQYAQLQAQVVLKRKYNSRNFSLETNLPQTDQDQGKLGQDDPPQKTKPGTSASRKSMFGTFSDSSSDEDSSLSESSEPEEQYHEVADPGSLTPVQEVASEPDPEINLEPTVEELYAPIPPENLVYGINEVMRILNLQQTEGVGILLSYNPLYEPIRMTVETDTISLSDLVNELGECVWAVMQRCKIASFSKHTARIYSEFETALALCLSQKYAPEQNVAPHLLMDLKSERIDPEFILERFEESVGVALLTLKLFIREYQLSQSAIKENVPQAPKRSAYDFEGASSSKEYGRSFKKYLRQYSSYFQEYEDYYEKIFPDSSSRLTDSALAQIGAEIGIAVQRSKSTKTTVKLAKEPTQETAKPQAYRSLIHEKPKTIPSPPIRPLGLEPVGQGKIHGQFQIPSLKDSKCHPCFDWFDANSLIPFAHQDVISSQGDTSPFTTTQFSHIAVQWGTSYSLSKYQQAINEVADNYLSQTQYNSSKMVLDPYSVSDGGYIQVNPEINYKHHHLFQLTRSYSGQRYSKAMQDHIINNKLTQLSVCLLSDLTYDQIRLPTINTAILYDYAITDQFGNINISNQKFCLDTTTVGSEILRVMGTFDMRTGANYSFWDIICPTPQVCAQVYHNLAYRLFQTPLRYFKWEVYPRKIECSIEIPSDIVKLPPCLYEAIIDKSSATSNNNVYMLTEMRQNPLFFWASSTPCIGYKGSLTIQQFQQGVSIEDLIFMPRFMIRYHNSRINSAQFLYNHKNNEFYDPYAIQKHKEYLETETSSDVFEALVGHQPNTVWITSLGNTVTEMVTHLVYLEIFENSIHSRVQNAKLATIQTLIDQVDEDLKSTMTEGQTLSLNFRKHALSSLKGMLTVADYYRLHRFHSSILHQIKFMALPMPIVDSFLRSTHPENRSDFRAKLVPFQIKYEDPSRPKVELGFFTSFSRSTFNRIREQYYPELSAAYDYRVQGGLLEAMSIEPQFLPDTSEDFKALFSGQIPQSYARIAQQSHEGRVANANRASDQIVPKNSADMLVYNIVDLIHDLQQRSVPDSIMNLVSRAGFALYLNMVFRQHAHRAEGYLASFARLLYVEEGIQVLPYVNDETVSQIETRRSLIRAEAQRQVMPPPLSHTPTTQSQPTVTPSSDMGQQQARQSLEQQQQLPVVSERYFNPVPSGTIPDIHGPYNPWTGLQNRSEDRFRNLISAVSHEQAQLIITGTGGDYTVQIYQPWQEQPSKFSNPPKHSDNTMRKKYAIYSNQLQQFGFRVKNRPRTPVMVTFEQPPVSNQQAQQPQVVTQPQSQSQPSPQPQQSTAQPRQPQQTSRQVQRSMPPM